MSVRYHPPLHVTGALARRVERAEIDFCAEAGAVGTRAGIASIEAGGGRALFGVTGSPLNKMLGLGLQRRSATPTSMRLKRSTRRMASPAQIELCPLAAPDVPPRLSVRGFVLQGFESQLARALGDGASQSDIAPGLRVAPARPLTMMRCGWMWWRRPSRRRTRRAR